MKKIFTSALALLLTALLLFSIAAPAAAAGMPTPTGFKAEYRSGNEPYIYCSWDQVPIESRLSVIGYAIAYSTDRENWESAYYDFGAKNYCSFSSFTDGSKPVKGTTYYFTLMFVGMGEDDVSAPSSIVSLKFGEAEQNPTTPTTPSTPTVDPALEKEWKALKKQIAAEPVMKSKNYDMALKKGTTVTYTSPFYKVTFTVTKMSKDGVLDQATYTIKFETDYAFKLVAGRYKTKTLTNGKSMKETIYVYGDYDSIPMVVKDNGFIKSVEKRFKGKVSDYDSAKKDLDKLKKTDCSVAFVGTEGVVSNFNRTYVSASYNSIMIMKTYDDFTLFYRKSGDKKWKKTNCNFESDFNLQKKTIKKLEPNTVYELRSQKTMKVKDEDGNTKTITGPYSQTYKVRTGANEKPVVTSVKVSNVKKYTIEHKGHYEYHGTTKVWVKPWTEKGTSYSVTIKVKALPKNAVGLVAGGIVGKGTSITFQKSVKGHVSKVSGSTQVCTYMESNGISGNGSDTASGTSPYVIVKYSN